MTLAEIITIGDELLIGQVVDTNSAWIGQKVNELGIKVHQITSVSDQEDHILKALSEARNRVDIIIITGGLGPTKDDITKKTLCKYFNTGFRLDKEVYENLVRLFSARGREVSDLNRLQAEVPMNCEALHNSLGTAPGMWFTEHGKIYISLPGVPHEMKGLMENLVLPRLKDLYKLPPIVHQNILTQGIGESFLSELISDWEDNLPKNMKLAYLPALGILRLRLTASGDEEKKLREQVQKEITKLNAIAGEFIYGYGDDKLEAIIGKILTEKKMSLSTAESCTGGYVSHRITSVPGSSDYYIGSVIAYANRIKESTLDIDPDLFRKYGAVSEEVARAMAESVKKNFRTDWSISTTGIAGPGGGSEEKPVGTVCIGISSPSGTFSKKLLLGNKREFVIMETANHALNMLRKALLKD